MLDVLCTSLADSAGFLVSALSPRKDSAVVRVLGVFTPAKKEHHEIVDMAALHRARDANMTKIEWIRFLFNVPP